MSRKHRANTAKKQEVAKKDETAPEHKGSALQQGHPEMHPQDLPAGPVHRGGSLLPCCDKDEKVDEASDESFPASDAPSWSPVKAA